MSRTTGDSLRQPQDLYATPRYAIDPILIELDYSKIKTALDPACGDGRILNTMSICAQALSREVNFHNHDIAKGLDYLAEPPIDSAYDLIITNPPYSLAQEFITKALQHARNVALLLRLNYLGAQHRQQWWQSRSPQRLFVLSKRPCFVHVCKGVSATGKRGCGATYPADTAPKECLHCGGGVRAATDATEYAWLCWGDAFLRPPGIYVL